MMKKKKRRRGRDRERKEAEKNERTSPPVFILQTLRKK